MDDHDHGPLTRDEVLEFTYGTLIEAAEEASAGRPTEGSVLNGIAGTALALAHELPELVPTLATGGPH